MKVTEEDDLWTEVKKRGKGLKQKKKLSDKAKQKLKQIKKIN